MGPSQRATVVLLGAQGHAGDAGDLTQAFTRLGARVSRVQNLTDPAKLLAEHAPDHVVALTPDVPADVLIALAERVPVFPTPRAARLAADPEGLRRLAGDELGLPTVPFWFAGSVGELAAVATHAGFPLLVTPLVTPIPTPPAAADRSNGGRSVLTRAEDVPAAWRAAAATGGVRVLAETVVEIDHQVTLVAVRSSDPAGPAVRFCEPIGTSAGPDGGLLAWQPHPLSPTALGVARSIAARIVHAIGGQGVFAVELLVRGDEVYFSALRPGPTDAALVTLRTQRLSQYELLARAVLGLAVDTIMISPGALEIGPAAGPASPAGTPDGANDDGRARTGAGLTAALAVPESDALFRTGRTVAIATAPDVASARDRARRVAAALHGGG